MVDLGVLPTPGRRPPVRRPTAWPAAMISASHNPFGDNGIKFFAPGGRKLDDADRGRRSRRELARLEREGIPAAADRPVGGGGRHRRPRPGAGERYAGHLVGDRRSRAAASTGLRVVARLRQRRRRRSSRRTVLTALGAEVDRHPRRARRRQHQRRLRLEPPASRCSGGRRQPAGRRRPGLRRRRRPAHRGRRRRQRRRRRPHHRDLRRRPATSGACWPTTRSWSPS